MKKITFIAALILMTIASTVPADTLMVDRIAQEKSIIMPTRGSTMNQVIKQFGEPKLKKSAVGEPPITEWQYEKFSVYFEHKWVITSVAYKVPKSQ